MNLQARYQPHASVIALPLYQSNSSLRTIIANNSVEEMAEDVRGWKGMFSTFPYKTMVVTVEWDLRTHYGFSEESFR